jgi:hypothetical protein
MMDFEQLHPLPDDLPDLMSPDDIADYLGVSQDRVTELRKDWDVVGTYAPPRGAVVPLYAAEDVVTRCRAAGHPLPPRTTRCKACRFDAQLARMNKKDRSRGRELAMA